MSKDHGSRPAILRGLAIISIVLHNFLHLDPFGFAGQNESTFSLDNTWAFFNGIGDGIGPFFGNLCSFLGWTGVPVFVFLSGYGLVKKYEKGNRPFSFGKHAFQSWRKLFCMMLPAAVYFMLPYFHDVSHIVKSLLSLTLLSNLAFDLLPPNPGVYWYFSLTFELYLLYALFHRNRSNTFILVAAICVFAVQSLLVMIPGMETVVHWNLKNFFGWLPIFVFGIWVSRDHDAIPLIHPIWLFLTALVCLGLLVLCNCHGIAWVFIHFPAFGLFLSLTLLVDRYRVLRSVFVWIGSMSAFLFVVHPIARGIVIRVLLGKVPLPVLLLVYLALCFALAFPYRWFFQKFLSFCEKRTPASLAS